jgi:hypothetical protein
MSDSQNTIKYVKHNKIRIKKDKERDEVTNVLLKFFEKIEEKPIDNRSNSLSANSNTPASILNRLVISPLFCNSRAVL